MEERHMTEHLSNDPELNAALNRRLLTRQQKTRIKCLTYLDGLLRHESLNRDDDEFHPKISDLNSLSMVLEVIPKADRKRLREELLGLVTNALKKITVEDAA
jgi:hypothetical protein